MGFYFAPPRGQGDSDNLEGTGLILADNAEMARVGVTGGLSKWWA